MKEIFTLVVFTAAMFSFAAAQPYGAKDGGYKDGKKGGYGRDDHNAFDIDKAIGYNNSYFLYKQRMEQVNREFDQKIAEVKRSWRLNGREKERQTRFLQMQRQHALDQLQHEFEKNNQQYRGKDRKYDAHW